MDGSANSPVEASKNSDQPVVEQLRSGGLTRVGTSVNAQFLVNQQVSTLGLTVVFIDESSSFGTDINDWSWDFNNDDIEDSQSQNPSQLMLKLGL